LPQDLFTQAMKKAQSDKDLALLRIPKTPKASYAKGTFLTIGFLCLISISYNFDFTKSPTQSRNQNTLDTTSAPLLNRPKLVSKPNLSVAPKIPQSQSVTIRQSYITTANLNMRTGPGTNFPVVGTLPKGACIELCQQSYRAGWSTFSFIIAGSSQINSRGFPVHVSQNYLREISSNNSNCKPGIRLSHQFSYLGD
jgi:uncharacterized protein YgiM (DUF1202 family)